MNLLVMELVFEYCSAPARLVLRQVATSTARFVPFFSKLNTAADVRLAHRVFRAWHASLFRRPCVASWTRCRVRADDTPILLF